MTTIEVSIGGGDDWMDVALSNDGYDHVPPYSPGNVGTCRHVNANGVRCGVPTVTIKEGNEWNAYHSKEAK